MKMWKVLVGILFFLPGAVSAWQAPVNLDFEQGQPGQAPPGWTVPSDSAGYTAQVATDKPESGKASGVLVADDTVDLEQTGNLVQSVDAAPYRGKRIRFRAASRAELESQLGRARIWIGLDRPGISNGWRWDYTSDPVVTPEWTRYEVLGEVPEDTRRLNLGLVLVGGGRAWIDSASIEIVGKVGEGDEPARALSGRGLDNLVAFTKLLGYVRFFHPSDQAAAADWEKLALAGVQAAEKAGSPEELARALETFFLPVAPTVRVYPTGQRPALPAELAPPAGEPLEATAWSHVGVGLSSQQPSIYSSQRVTLGSDKESPAKPFVADLGGGVSAMVPLALYKDARGTLPHVSLTVRPASPDKPEGFIPSGKDRATRLSDVALAWNVFQHFYPYFDVVRADWPAELRRALSSAATDKDTAAFLTTLRRLVAALEDGHGNVFHPSEPASHLLPLVWDWVEDRLVVTRVDPEKAPGISRGDVVVAIDGRPAREVLAAREELISSATPQWKRFRSLRALLAGAENEEVRLTLQPPAGETKTVAVRRSLSFQQNPKGFEDLRPEEIAEIRPGIFYVDLDRVQEETFKAAVERLAGARGIIFDMRGYPNGSALDAFSHLIDEPMSSARWQTPQVKRPDREDMTFKISSWPVPPAAPRFKAKVAFITDGRAISYAETCMGMIEAYKVAPIVGAPTAGTNGNVNPWRLPGGYRLAWTGMRVLKHDGSRFHGVGILPTHPVSRTLKGVAEGRDEFLEKAIELVSSP